MPLVTDPPKKKRAVVLVEAKPGEQGRDMSFVTEAENLKSFYGRTEPDRDVQIIPFYGKDELESVKKSLSDIGEEDQVFLFGHSGSKIGGVKNEELAGMFKEAGVKNCALGSCNFENYVEPFKGIPNLMYRPMDQWLGVNPRAESLESAMFSRRNDYDLGRAVVAKPREGMDYKKLIERKQEQPVPVPQRDLPIMKSMPLASML